MVMGIDPSLVIPNPNLNIFDTITCWKGEKMSKWKSELIQNAHHFDFPIHDAYHELSEENKLLLWEGNNYFKGLHYFSNIWNENLIRFSTGNAVDIENTATPAMRQIED